MKTSITWVNPKGGLNVVGRRTARAGVGRSRWTVGSDLLPGMRRHSANRAQPLLAKRSGILSAQGAPSLLMPDSGAGGVEQLCDSAFDLLAHGWTA